MSISRSAASRPAGAAPAANAICDSALSSGASCRSPIGGRSFHGSGKGLARACVINAHASSTSPCASLSRASARLAAEHLTLAAGTDIAPLLKGLPEDACQSVHWGYFQSGTALVTYTDGASERCTAGDFFHWPAGHSVCIEEDATIVMFSPADDHGRVLDHLGAQLA